MPNSPQFDGHQASLGGYIRQVGEHLEQVGGDAVNLGIVDSP